MKKVSLLPFALGLAVVFGLILFQVDKSEKSRISQDSRNEISAAQKMIYQWLWQDAEAMGIAIEAMKSNGQLRKALSSKDTKALRALSSSTSQKLQSAYKIDQAFFYDSERGKILDAYNPEGTGGVEENPIIVQAERTGKAAWGLSLDSSGQVWLRMSHPVLDDGDISGYIELGKNVSKLGPKVLETFGLDFSLAVDKSFLSKADWTQRQMSLGIKGDWDALTNHVAASSTANDGFASALAVLGALESGQAATGRILSAGDGKVMGEVLPLEVGGKQAVYIVLSKRIDGILSASKKSVLTLGAVSMVAGIALLGLLFFSVSRLEKGVTNTQEMMVKDKGEVQRLSAAVEQAGDSIMITDPDGIIQYVNPAFEKTTGFTRAEVLGKKPSIIKSGKHNARFYKKMWNTIKGGKVWHGHFINRKKNGSLYEEESTISPITDAAGNVLNFLAIKNDVTLVSSLTKAREYFTTVTSHELATPIQRLGFVRTLMAEMLKNNEGDDKLNKIVAALESSYTDLQRVQNATNLLSHLSFNKVEETGRNIFVQPVLTSCVESARDEMQKEGRNVEIMLEVGDIPVKTQLFGKQDLVTQALDETLSNAIKYTPDGKKVHVSASLEGTLLLILIEDEGKGMTNTALDQIFEPFFSPSSPSLHSTGRYMFEGGGMGLGLTITRMIVEYHGGNLDLRSGGAGQGTSVRLTMPVFI